MILVTLLFGAVLIAGAATYWSKIVDWLKRAIQKVKEIVNMVVYGVKVFVRKINEAIKEISKHYSQDEYGKWHETVVTREVDESEVPSDIRERANRARNEEIDITDELELKLA